jgi:hypothetical protein
MAWRSIQKAKGADLTDLTDNCRINQKKPRGRGIETRLGASEDPAFGVDPV